MKNINRCKLSPNTFELQLSTKFKRYQQYTFDYTMALKGWLDKSGNDQDKGFCAPFANCVAIASIFLSSLPHG